MCIIEARSSMHAVINGLQYSVLMGKTRFGNANLQENVMGQTLVSSLFWTLLNTLVFLCKFISLYFHIHIVAVCLHPLVLCSISLEVDIAQGHC